MKGILSTVLAITMIGSLLIAPAAEEIRKTEVAANEAIVYNIGTQERFAVEFESTETAQNSSIRTRVH